MTAANVIGWSVTALLIAGGLLRALTVWLHENAFGGLQLRLASRWILVTVATVAAALAVLGSIFLPLPGLWGPAVLVFAVIWAVNDGWKLGGGHHRWVAPVETGLRYGERIVLLGGSLGTLIGYLLVTVV